MDIANYSASKRPQDPSFPLPPPKRRRIRSSRQPSYFPPRPLLPSPLLPPLIPVATPSRPRGRPRIQPAPVAALRGRRGRPRGRPLQPFEGALLSLGFISEFHNVPEESRVHDLGAMDIECDKCHALFWKEELVPLSNPRE